MNKIKETITAAAESCGPIRNKNKLKFMFLQKCVIIKKGVEREIPEGFIIPKTLANALLFIL